MHFITACNDAVGMIALYDPSQSSRIRWACTCAMGDYPSCAHLMLAKSKGLILLSIMSQLTPSLLLQVRPKRRAPITQVLMVGGATRMPAFLRFVRNMTGLEAKGVAVDPDEVHSCTCEAPKAFSLCRLLHIKGAAGMKFIVTRSKQYWSPLRQHAL